MRYLPGSAADRSKMLEATGHKSLEELFSQIPEELRLRGRLNIPCPSSEQELLELFREMAKQSSW